MIFTQISKHILEKSNIARNRRSGVETTQRNIHFTEGPTTSKLQMLQYNFKEILQNDPQLAKALKKCFLFSKKFPHRCLHCQFQQIPRIWIAGVRQTREVVAGHKEIGVTWKQSQMLFFRIDGDLEDRRRSPSNNVTGKYRHKEQTDLICHRRSLIQLIELDRRSF